MVLLVIDVQKGITDERLYGFEKFEENLKSLIEASRKSGVEVIYVRHDDGPGSGFSIGDADFEIYDGIVPVAGEKIFDKKVNSAFHESTGLDMYLQSKNIKKVIAVGLQTDYCVDATVKSGFEKGFEMIVPEYCNSTRSNPYMDAKTTYEFYNKSMWPGRYATCPTVPETLEMIRNYNKCDDPFRINRCGTKEIETERLILRPFVQSDAQSALDNWAGDEAVQTMYGEPVYGTVEEVRELLDEFIVGYKSGFAFRWAIVEKQSGECIGQIAYFLVDESGSWGEIEYCIGRAFQGKGYATEATKAIISYGFDKIGFNKVQICVRPSNIKSKKVIEKCGFEYEGTLRDYFFIDGGYEGRMYYSILKPEMNLRDFDNKCVRITDVSGDVYEGTAIYYDREYVFHEYGCDEEALCLTPVMFYKTDISSVISLESNDGPFGHYSEKYGLLERKCLEEGADLIGEIFDSDDDEGILRMLYCMNDSIQSLTDLGELKNMLDTLVKYNKDERVVNEAKGVVWKYRNDRSSDTAAI